MVTLHIPSLRRQAKDLLAGRREDPKKLVLLHTGISLGVTLLMTFLNFLFAQKIADTGGLSGLGTRSILSTVQSTMELTVLILLPFWEIGILKAAQCWKANEDAHFLHLTEGFRRFIAVFAKMFWTTAVLTVIGLGILYFAVAFYLLTPGATPLLEQLNEMGTIVTPEQMANYPQEELAALMQQMLPIYIIFGILFGSVSLVLLYSQRFADFFLMEGEGGIKSMGKSFLLVVKNCLQVLKLDLHFWWFYLLQTLCVVICYGGYILPYLGVTLPFGEDGNFFIFYVLGIALQCILFWQFQGEKLTTYYLAFDALQQPHPPAEL